MAQALMVLVDDAHIATTRAIARKVRRCGFVVDRVVPTAGAIRAIGDPGRAGALREIVGVIEVRPEATLTLPPMSERIPQ
jgi:hypothetical protein